MGYQQGLELRIIGGPLGSRRALLGAEGWETFFVSGGNSARQVAYSPQDEALGGPFVSAR